MKMQISKDWLRKKIAEDNEPTGCIACGAIAGCCDDYPKCPGNEAYEAGQPVADLHYFHAADPHGG